jgi:hypothetical protein
MNVAVVVVAECPINAGVFVEVFLLGGAESSFGSGSRCDVSGEVTGHGSQVEVVLCPYVVVVRVPREWVLHVEERRVVGVDVVEAPGEGWAYWGHVVPSIVVIGGSCRRLRSLFLNEGG